MRGKYSAIESELYNPGKICHTVESKLRLLIQLVKNFKSYRPSYIKPNQRWIQNLYGIIKLGFL
jgi:hypothetical protein